MNKPLVLHNRNELREFTTFVHLNPLSSPVSLRGAERRSNLITKVDIPNFTPKEIVNFVLKYKGIAEVWIRTATLSSVSCQKWLKFKTYNSRCGHSGSFKPYLFKREMDIALGVILLFLSLPLFIIATLLIKRNSPGSIIYQQPRVNNDLKIFNLYKFRTMIQSPKKENNEAGQAVNLEEKTHQDYMRKNIKAPNPNQKVHKLINDPRITEIGKWIRRLSMDELPQLINVVKGEMSLVGPRPPIPYEVQEYAEWHFARFSAKIGLTGLWQAMGRSLIPFDEMVVLDLYYACNQSLWLDIKLLFQTIPMVLSLKGAF